MYTYTSKQGAKLMSNEFKTWEEMSVVEQIEKFFRNDIKFMYFAQFEDGLPDGIEAHFG